MVKHLKSSVIGCRMHGFGKTHEMFTIIIYDNFSPRFTKLVNTDCQPTSRISGQTAKGQLYNGKTPICFTVMQL